jgi:hypothetical protein
LLFENPAWVGWLKELGFDGAIVRDNGVGMDKVEYWIFDPQQAQVSNLKLLPQPEPINRISDACVR